MSDNHLSDLRFDALPLHETILAGIRTTPASNSAPLSRPVRCRSRCSRSDVAGQAQTGTGKTAAFLMAAFQRLMTHR